MFEDRQMEIIQSKNQIASGSRNISDLIEMAYSEYIQTNEIPIELLSKLSLDDLLFYIEQSHQYYLVKSLPQISQSIQNLSKVISNSHPSILVLDHFFHKYFKHLKDHIELEDEQIFPYVRTLVEVQNGDFKKLDLLKLCDTYILSTFHENHTDTEIDIKKVRRAIMDFKPPHHANSQYRILLHQLKSFELDLHFHAIIEEEILIPKALQLEKVIRS
jgi:regulator of cell morphogenesis and NO signaling